MVTKDLVEEKTELIGQLDFYCSLCFQMSIVPLSLLAQKIKNNNVFKNLPDFNVQRDSRPEF